MPRKKGTTPAEDYLKERLKEVSNTGKMERELRRYGKKIPGGYMWTVGDMQRYFAKKKRK